VANGSPYLIRVLNGPKVVLVLPDADHYKKICSKDWGKGLPASYEPS